MLTKQLLHALVLVLTLVFVHLKPVVAQVQPQRVWLPAIHKPAFLLRGEVMEVATLPGQPDFIAVVYNPIWLADGEVGLSLLISRTGGLTWEGLAKRPWEPAPLLLGSSQYALAPTSAGISIFVLITGWRAGVGRVTDLYRTEDDGVTWALLTLPTLDPCGRDGGVSIHTSPAAPNSIDLALFCSSATGPNGAQFRVWVFRSQDLGQTWAPLPGIPYQNVGIRRSRVTESRLWQFSQTRVMSVSQDVGQTWAQAGVVPGELMIESRFAPNRLISPGVSGGFTSDDLGQTWRAWRDLPCDLVRTIAPYVEVQGSPPSIYSVCANGRLIRSLDGGQTWTLLDLLPGSKPAETILDPDFGDGTCLFIRQPTPGGGLWIYQPSTGLLVQVLDVRSPGEP